MNYDWCSQCGGEMVSCECEEVEEYDDYEPDEDDYEEIDDSRVIFSINDNGVGRIEVY
jgi:hypothetical protein